MKLSGLSAFAFVSGTTVTWTDEDSATHDVASNSLKSGNLSKGRIFSFKFDGIVIYSYSDGIYPTMKETIIVR